MSANKKQEKICKIFESFKNANRKVQVTLLQENNKKLLNFLAREKNNIDATDGAFKFLSQISDSLQEELTTTKKIYKDAVKDICVAAEYKR